MNQRQIKVMWFGITAAVLLLLFPPWHVGEVVLPPSFPHHLINPPTTFVFRGMELDCQGQAEVDWMRLGMLLTVTLLITGGLLLTLRDRRAIHS